MIPKLNHEVDRRGFLKLYAVGRGRRSMVFHQRRTQLATPRRLNNLNHLHHLK